MSAESITVFPADPGPTASALMGTFGMMAVGLCLMTYSGMPFCGRMTGIRLYPFRADVLYQPCKARRFFLLLEFDSICVAGARTPATRGPAVSGVADVLGAVREAWALQRFQDSCRLSHGILFLGVQGRA